MKLTAVILTKNEETNIGRCLKSVAFCDEILIVDDNSEDKTLDIVHKVYKVLKVHKVLPVGRQVYEVIQRKLDGNFSAQRNFAMGKASGDWILFVDADEEVTRELKDEISRIILNSVQHDTVAYYLKRRDYFWGRELTYGETMKARNSGIIRLVKKNSGSWEGKVHEEYRVKSSNLKVQSLGNYLNHYPHQTVKEFLQEVNFYSTLRAKELFAQGKKTNIFAILFYPLGKFILTYFLRRGFLDGPPGFAYVFFMSFHSFLVRAKLYQLTWINTERDRGNSRN